MFCSEIQKTFDRNVFVLKEILSDLLVMLAQTFPHNRSSEYELNIHAFAV